MQAAGTLHSPSLPCSPSRLKMPKEPLGQRQRQMGDHIQTSKLRKLGHKHPSQVLPALGGGSDMHLSCLNLLEFLPWYNKQTHCCAGI